MSDSAVGGPIQYPVPLHAPFVVVRVQVVSCRCEPIEREPVQDRTFCGLSYAKAGYT